MRGPRRREVRQVDSERGTFDSTIGWAVTARDKRTRLIHQQLDLRGLRHEWWQVAETAVDLCERGRPVEPVLTGGGPAPARSVVALLGLEALVEGGVDWAQHDELTEPGGAFYPPNSEVPMPKTETARQVLQEWFFPSGASSPETG